jgi:hypothetical protein
MDFELIKKVESVFNQGFMEETFECAGIKWKIRTLDDQESTWRDRFIALSSSSSFLSEKRVPTLAIAIREIDGKSILEIFHVDKKPQSDEEEALIRLIMKAEKFNDDPKFEAAFALKNTLDKLPSAAIDVLFAKYIALEEKSNSLLNKIASDPNFFRVTSDKGPDTGGQALRDGQDGSVAG